ncbi:hypothetical protein ACOSQ2_020639 [Xanthoceras sorbifolium]
MGVKSTGAWGSMAWFMFIMLFWKIGAYCGDQSAVLASDDALCFDKSENSISHQHARRKLDDIAAAISIDCGAPVGFSHTDDKTELIYESDEEFINTGVKKNISSKRLDFGSTNNEIIRYKDDRYDRMWFPYPGSQTINTSSIIDTQVESDYRLQSTVMRTAVRAINVNESLEFDFDNEDPILEFYVYMHFAELENLQENQHREFNIELNGNLTSDSTLPPILNAMEIYTVKDFLQASTDQEDGMFLLIFFSDSTLPPILNAMEIYTVKDFLQASTDQEDVGENWQGDPCAPTHYPWDGLNCSYNGYNPPRIISLGLTGRILPSLSNLKSLHYLDLSNNSLTGTIPEILSQLPNLSVLNLEGNKLSGPVPAVLKARS